MFGCEPRHAGDPYAALDAMSDDEAREDLRREQEQRLLAASQARHMTLRTGIMG